MKYSEEWRRIPFAPPYKISSLGRVSRAGAILKPFANHRGYLLYTLCMNGKTKKYSSHRLVCWVFHGPPPSPEYHAAHKDGDRLNNRPENLYWATAKQNVADTRRHGTMQCGDQHWSRRHPERVPRGENHHTRRKPEAIRIGSQLHNAKLDEDAIRIIRATPRVYGSGRELAKRFGVTGAAISAVRNGKNWSHIV